MVEKIFMSSAKACVFTSFTNAYEAQTLLAEYLARIICW
jgi:hypothetical protein